jgi:16S rRNA (cytidine1402-2'-O)-methyltransferase
MIFSSLWVQVIFIKSLICSSKNNMGKKKTKEAVVGVEQNSENDEQVVPEETFGRLSVVATPIGNLGDITLRALDTLRAADAIACEDTRVTARLLARYEISKPLLVYHAESGRSATARVLTLLAEGKHVALVTDAGTPGISDPGTELIAEVRQKLSNEVRIEALPGASAITASLSIAGIPCHEFVFMGFLPHKKGRQTKMRELAEIVGGGEGGAARGVTRPVIFYESPHRIEKALAELAAVLPENTHVIVLRELTKIFESVVTGTATELQTYFKEHPGQVRGEFVVIVSAN